MNKLLIPVAVLLLGIAWVAAGISEDPESHTPRLTGSQAFRVFNSPSVQPSPGEIQKIRDALALYEPSARTRVIHRSHTKRGDVWLVATQRLACIIHARGSACAPIQRAIEDGVILGVFDPPDQRHKEPHNFLVLGLVADDVTAVSALVNYRRNILLSAKGNLVLATGEKPIHVRRLVRD